MYAPNILKRYFSTLLDLSKNFGATHLVFNLLNEIVNKPELKWVPIQEIKEAIKSIEN